MFKAKVQDFMGIKKLPGELYWFQCMLDGKLSFDTA